LAFAPAAPLGELGAGITSVERFAASAVLSGVAAGCAGGGCRTATGFLAAQPKAKSAPAAIKETDIARRAA
jgi:hypothetical protein